MKTVLCVAAITMAVLYAPPASALGANSDSNLKQRVAQQVMEDTHHRATPESITLVNVHRGMFRVTWEADTPNGHYVCSGDDMLRQATCTHIEDEPAR